MTRASVSIVEVAFVDLEDSVAVVAVDELVVAVDWPLIVIIVADEADESESVEEVVTSMSAIL